jgi:cytochrome c5
MSARIRWSAWTGALVAASCIVVPVARGAAPTAPRGAPSATTAARAPTLADTYAEECGSCHVPYPAKMLAPTEWSAVLARLDRHYGVDATLEGPALARVAAALGVAPPKAAASTNAALPRITTQPWFQREHAPRRLARHGQPSVKLSQCDSCHRGAASGRFEEEEGER